MTNCVKPLFNPLNTIHTRNTILSPLQYLLMIVKMFLCIAISCLPELAAPALPMAVQSPDPRLAAGLGTLLVYDGILFLKN